MGCEGATGEKFVSKAVDVYGDGFNVFRDLRWLAPLILHVNATYNISLFPGRNWDLILPDSQSAWSGTHLTSCTLAKGGKLP